MERDDDVLEYYDQSSRIPPSHRAKSGRRTTDWHSPGFFVLRRSSAGWEEWKPARPIACTAYRHLLRGRASCGGSCRSTSLKRARVEDNRATVIPMKSMRSREGLKDAARLHPVPFTFEPVDASDPT